MKEVHLFLSAEESSQIQATIQTQSSQLIGLPSLLLEKMRLY